MTNELPEYVRQPIFRCIKTVRSVLTMLQLTEKGFTYVAHRPRMTQPLIDLTVQLEEEPTEEIKAGLVRETEDASFAEGEIKNNFPFMHASATVTMWGALEAAIEDLLVGIALNEPVSLERDEFMKIKIPLGRFIVLEKDERIRYLITEAQRSLSTGNAQGVDTFENVLRLFDLSGEVDESVKKGLWEMNNVRNVIVHRDSQADLRLVQSCPWLGAKVGERILIDAPRFYGYHEAIYEYIGTLFRRVSARYQLPVAKIWLPRAQQ